ncbi:MAG: Crp/Fnr family transcriptional regulator [Bacteroidetes bacterium]|nr:Crp/Fnr family transcriptional regulator [Bacteroidota bacterium]
MSQLLINNIQKYVQLNDEEKYMLLSIMQNKKIRKRQYLMQEGDHSKYSAFVLSGCLRSYFIDSNGFEHILQFAIEDWWITDMMSYISGKPGKLNIDALEDSEVLLISRDDQLSLFDKSPKFEKYFRIITENGMVSNQQRLLDNLSLPAIERYKNFIHKYPLFMQRIPQVQIAAFLGITPEFLSKIRGQMSKS